MNPYDLWDGIVQALHHPGVRYATQLAVNGVIAYMNTRGTLKDKNYLIAAVVPTILVCAAEVPFASHNDAGKLTQGSSSEIAIIEGTAYAIQLGSIIAKERSERKSGSTATLDTTLHP